MNTGDLSYSGEIQSDQIDKTICAMKKERHRSNISKRTFAAACLICKCSVQQLPLGVIFILIFVSL